MDALLAEIMDILRSQEHIDMPSLAAIIRRHNQDIENVSDHLSKKKAMRYYLAEKRARSDKWNSWNIDRTLDERLIKTLQVKPRRTASGVATITVITKPMPCSGTCVFCPNDVRMPKSYLTDEPACQRAERNFFDPYLQVVSRMRALREMGHETDKVELIVLGGTWSDYPEAYQLWFITELFRALNDGEAAESHESDIRSKYRLEGIDSDPCVLKQQVSEIQALVDAQSMSYNEACEILYGPLTSWGKASEWQTATIDELLHEQVENENADHRVVGLVVETQPGAVTPDNLAFMRLLGCTKVQMGLQTLDPQTMAANRRTQNLEAIRNAFSLLRLFGFKIHVHFMANLMGSTPERDLEDYTELVTNRDYLPDEIKLYPCVLVHSARLRTHYENGEWSPYAEDTLVPLLAQCLLKTPPYMRISRMIRDISAHDIKAGNQKTNLRQLVELSLGQAPLCDREIRLREISVGGANVEDLNMDEIRYDTSVSNEIFLQWVTPDGKIAGFLRLSLPHREALSTLENTCIDGNDAMIREVHVYGRVARIHDIGMGAQHLGLGKALVERACEIAKTEGYDHVNVISSIGTRNYYRKLNFHDAGLYQKRTL